MDIFDKNYIRSKRRETILKAAGQLFCVHGFNAVSVDQLASDLGIAKTVIYSHFDNKVAIFKACHLASTELLESAIAQATSAEPLERIKTFIHTYVPNLLGNHGPGAVLLDLEILPDNMGIKIRERRDNVYRQIQSWLEEATQAKTGNSNKTSAAIFTKIMFGGINVLPKWYRKEDTWTPQMIADSIYRMVEGWVHNPDGNHKHATAH